MMPISLIVCEKKQRLEVARGCTVFTSPCAREIGEGSWAVTDSGAPQKSILPGVASVLMCMNR
eukprot:COSAG02_NODE_1399_length_12852_cov_83.666745_3_plen_63_part_00